MRAGRQVAYLARRSATAALVAVLVFALPAYGTGSEASPTTPPDTSVDRNPVATPSTPGTPAADQSASAVSIGPSRTTPDASVIGDPGVDATTQEFRAALAQKQARLDAFTAQLEELDRELAIASEAYNAASDKLAAMTDKVHTAELDLASANDQYDRISEILDDQLGTIYRSGTYSPVELLLDAKSLSDFLSRLKFLNTVGTDSAQVLEEYASTQAELEAQVFKLKNAKLMAQSLEFELKARKIEVQLRIIERQELFTKTQADLLLMLSEQAARRQAEEAVLLKEILAGASKAGIQVSPGSPVETALSYHGIPYLWGGETTAGFDCSGLLLYVMRQHGVNLPHYSGSQFLLGEKIAPAELQPGDAVFFGSPIHHVGMYIGGGYFIHAPRTGDFVKISLLADRSDYAGARRYAWQPRLTPISDPVASTASALSTAD